MEEGFWGKRKSYSMLTFCILDGALVHARSTQTLGNQRKCHYCIIYFLFLVGLTENYSIHVVKRRKKSLISKFCVVKSLNSCEIGTLVDLLEFWISAHDRCGNIFLGLFYFWLEHHTYMGKARFSSWSVPFSTQFNNSSLESWSWESLQFSPPQINLPTASKLVSFQLVMAAKQLPR